MKADIELHDLPEISPARRRRPRYRFSRLRGKAQAVVRRNLGRVYGFEFLSLTAELTQLVLESCKRVPVYKGNSLGI